MDAAQSLHPTDQTLSSYGLGKLDDRSAEAVNEHLEHCSNCRKRVAEIPADSFLGRVRGAQTAGEPASGPSPTGGTPGDQRSKAPALDPADMLPPGLAEHPDYEIERELGRGGMGVVYLAHNKLMGRDEVLKVMGKQIMDRPGVLDRFLREIRAVASLRHPNIVTAYSAARLDESIVFAMEYVEGLDLSKVVKAKGPLPVGHACHFVSQAALGLQHAHEEGLVHRDIKPGNLMLSRKRGKAAVKVLDFGLAKATREEKIDGGLTHEGQALGTPDFIAPEQILDAQSADVRADIYSLGGTFYYLLTGRPPFKANSLYDIYQAHISRDADPLNLIRPEVPAELAALVAKMMAKNPARRFQTPGEIAEALTPFFKRGSVAFQHPQVAVAQAVRATAGPTVTGAVSTRTQAATDVGGAAVPLQKAVEPPVPEGRWEGLIDFRETERSIETKPGVAPLGWSPRVWRSVAVGVLMFGFVAAWLAGAFRVRTPEGDLVFDGLPNESVVTIDGKVSTVEWPGGRSPAKVSVSAGEHRVLVEHGGVTVHGEDVMIEAGDKRRIKVRWEPRLAAQPPKNHAVATATSTDATPESPAQAQAGKPPMPPGASRSTIPPEVADRKAKVFGQWSIEGEELVQVGKDNPSACIIGDVNWSNYDLDFEVMATSGPNGFETWLHYNDLGIVVMAWGGHGNADHALAEIYGGKRVEYNEVKQKGAIRYGRWYPVRFQVRGSQISCFADGRLAYRDQKVGVSNGRIALATFASTARFRNVRITTPDGVILWEGLPELPGR